MSRTGTGHRSDTIAGELDNDSDSDHGRRCDHRKNIDANNKPKRSTAIITAQGAPREIMKQYKLLK